MKAWIVKDIKRGILLSLDYPFQPLEGVWWVSNSITLNRNQIPQELRDNLTYTNCFEIQIKIKEPKLCIKSF